MAQTGGSKGASFRYSGPPGESLVDYLIARNLKTAAKVEFSLGRGVVRLCIREMWFIFNSLQEFVAAGYLIVIM